MKVKSIFLSILVLFFTTVFLLSACLGGDETAETTSEPSATSSATTAPATEEPPDTGSSEGEGELTEGVLEVVSSRTPEPTPEPDALSVVVSELVEGTSLERATFLGLSAEDWINLGISVAVVVLGYTFGNWLVRSVLKYIFRRTPTKFDDQFLEVIKRELRWLITLISLNFAVFRLDFLGEGLYIALVDIFFIAFLTLITYILWKLLDFSLGWYTDEHVEEEDKDRLSTLIKLLQRMGRIFLIVMYLIVLLDHYGINVTALATALGIGGLALSLAAQDTLADAISGFIIMLDQPFRIGDRIEISGLGTWGDVAEIGVRTTRIRTRDNRLVIVPNSSIASNQVVNYTYPDPQYRVQIDIGIGYGQDIEWVRQVIHDTVRQVEGVLPDKPVDSLYNEMGDSAMLFRARWWIESYEDTRRIFDRVNTALQKALDAEGIESPFTTYDVNFKLSEKEVDNLSKAIAAPAD
jgi:small-conductance mechanosensitive channel